MEESAEVHGGRRMRRVLVLHDDKAECDQISEKLADEGCSVQTATEPEGAIHRIKAWKPHLVFANVDIPSFNWASFLTNIRLLGQEDYTAIVLLTSKPNKEELKKGIELGADDYLVRPVNTTELLCRLLVAIKLKETQDSLKRANHRIEELSATDDLTGLMNMRAIFRRSEEEIARARKGRKAVSCLLINVDGFSNVNQSFGFVHGSHVLREMAIRIRNCLRTVDSVARVGADEFFALLNETDLAGAEVTAQRIRDAIQSNAFKIEKRFIKLTVTIGVAGFKQEQNHMSMNDLIHIATEALKSAKANGTNRIEVYSFT